MVWIIRGVAHSSPHFTYYVGLVRLSRMYCGLCQIAALKFDAGSLRANEQLADAKHLQIFEAGIKLHAQWLARHDLELGVETFRSAWLSLVVPT